MLLLIDLDGTLTNTAHQNFKPFKDGVSETMVQDIPLIPGAKEFISEVRRMGHSPIIISDSHPRYVDKIASEVFQVPALSLADKPNAIKTREFINTHFPGVADIKSQALVIGDTWLDIELGRALNCPTVLTNFYNATSEENRDGIGQDWKHLKSGPTFYASKFPEIYKILTEPRECLLAVEAIFQNSNSTKAVRFKTEINSNRFTAFRTLGRQNAGECDEYGVADKYFEFQRQDRSPELLNCLAEAVSNFLRFISESMPAVQWDYFTYVSDKATTQPANKMQELFELIETPIPKQKFIRWKDNINGSIRNQKDFRHRMDFVNENISIEGSASLDKKNILIIDDQFTTGATAYSICNKFREKGVNSIVFITLFYLITTVDSEKVCPHCGLNLQVKVNRSNGSRFLTCTPPRYNGRGCGNYIQNI